MKFTPRILWLSTFLSPLVMVSTVGQNMALAQIIPDNTLREESSIVTPGSADGRLTEVLINGGAERGSALFHSFDDFNVNSGQEVSFVPGSSINQIFSRVTGGRISNINGLLGVDGLADLFFLNPNGVIFGPNAELDVGGSFVVTTGDRILFNKDISFSAVNPQAPSSLLTITSPFGIQFGANPGAIHVRQSDLAVPQGENLALIGGDIRINNGANLTARDGHLNLSAVSEAGIVDFKREASNPRNLVQIPDGIERANIALRNNSQGQVQGNGTGTIMLQANNVTLSGSQLQAGINQDSGAIDTRGGAIRIEATGDVRLVQRAEIRNEVRETALGNGGRIVIWGDRLLMRDGSEIRTGTSSSGSAGSIRIKVDQLILEEGNVPETPSEPRPDDEDDRPPRPDDEDDRPPRPDDEDDRPPRPDEDGDRPPRPDEDGDRPPRPDEDGDRPPRPDDEDDRPPRPDDEDDRPPRPDDEDDRPPRPDEDGDRPPRPDEDGDRPPRPDEDGDRPPRPDEDGDRPPRPDEDGDRPPRPDGDDDRPPRPEGENPPPQLRIVGSRNSSSVRNEETRPNMENSSSSAITTISSDAKTGATGSTGSISIDAAEIRLEGEVRIQVRNEVDETTAGNIRIIQSSDPLRRAASVQLLLGAQINSETEGRNATAGNVIIRATEVLLDDIGSLGDNPGGIDSTVQDGAINGRGGDVRINAQTLTNRGARIGTTVRGRGQGGTVILNVDDTILLTGNTESNDRADPQFGLGLIASAVRRPEDDVRLPDADPDNPDQGGDIVIRTGHLILENGAEIEAGAQRGGTGGEINIVADSVQLLRGETQGKVNRIVAQLEEEEGQGGGIEIVTDQLRVEEGSSISVATLAGGDSGDISIHADDIVVTGIFEKTGNPPPRRRENNGDDQPSSSSNPEDNLLRSEILANSDNRARGNAGTVDIETSTLEISDRARVSASVIESGETGNVNIRADNLTLDNGTISAEAVEGDDGNIKLIVQDRLLLLNGSSITATASETATGGRIIIDPVLVLLSDGSEITASNTSKEDTTEPINGGTIDLVTDFLVSVNAPNALTATAFEGDGGRINLTSISNYGDLNVDVSSVNGFDGEFNDNSLNLDPTQSLLELPSAFSDANNQVRNACAPGERGRGSFAVTGRSGLPSSPLSQTSSPILLPDLGPFGIMSTANNASTASIQTAQAEDVTARNTRLQEAQAWEIAANGTVTLSSTPEAESSIDDLLLQGRRAYNHADYQRAIALWTQAAEPLSDSSSANPDHSLVLASTLSNLALAYRQLGAWQQAEQAITASQSLFSVDQLSDPSAIAPVFAQALNTKAQLAFASGDIRGAIATWQQADAAYGQAQNPVGQIQTRLHLVQALNNLGLYDQAQEQLTGVTPVLEATTLSQETAIAHLNRGILLQQNGDLEEARQAFQESLTIAQSLDQATAKVTISSAILMNLGHLEYAQAQSPSLSRAMAYGKRGEALQYYQQAIATAAESGIESSALNTARLQAQLSTITLLQDQQRTEQRRNTQLMANSRTPLWQQQATRSAPSPFTRTDEASEAPSNLSATGSGNRTSQGQGVNWQSITALSLLTTAESLPASRDTLYTQLHLAHLFMEADQLEEEGLNITPNQIQTILQRVEQHARELGDRQALAYSLGYQGQLYAKAQQWDRTRTSTEQALYLSQQLLSPEMSYRWHWQLGQAYVAQGQKKKAIAVYTEAVKALKIVRADLASTRADVQFSFRDSVEPLYRQLVQLLLQPDDSSTVINHPSDSPTEHSADHPSKPSQANLKAARALIEDLQLAELQDYFKDACVTTTLEIDTVDPKAAVIYPIILNANLGGQTADQSGQRLDVILSMDGQPLDHYSTTIEDAGQVQQTVDDLLAALTTPFDSQLAQTTKNLQQVYNWILKPMDGSLKQLQPETLVFVADGPLRSLPFSALHDGQQYLVERYNVSISPGLRLFESQPLNNTEVSVFAGGISEARPGFTALPFVADEVQQIASQIPDNQILLNDQLTVANFAKGLADSPADVLHLATHGKFGADAASTFLLMWDQQLTIDEFSNLLQQRNQTALSPIDLLVLSACETAAGDSRAVLGIAGMAIKAGVRSAIAGLWPLNDQATSVFMEAFYQALAQPGTTKVEAFQQAQRVLMQDERFQAPYYWSPFVLVGNWQ